MQEDIEKFDVTLADNLCVWGATEMDIANHMLQSLWDPADDDPELQKWQEETFLAGNDLGVEEEQNLSSEELFPICTQRAFFEWLQTKLPLNNELAARLSSQEYVLVRVETISSC